MKWNTEKLAQCYEQYVAENYLGGTGEAITYDNFLEEWQEMTESERNALFDRTKK